MNADSPDAPRLSALTSLRRFARPRSQRERCELCDAELAETHAHLVELSNRRLVCACDACAILFDNQGGGKYRRVPRRVQFLADFRLPEETWAALHLPIDLAFFLHSTAAGCVLALYPSPAGATEALVPVEAWQVLVEDNPILRELQPDVEALLVNRVGQAREHYRVGVDKCYELVGLLRTHWRGLSGGPAVWEAIGRFFTGLRGGAPHA
ncbi:MAG TPA: DUF5947 family protein [Gemmataceae bacterium]|nr:DUF5947 family protein [Gemmataceae bacterium]